MSVFERAFGVIVGFEGGFDTTPGDPGNWTGGRVGSGILRGTKFGISAAAQPERDIATLTLAEAQAIYRQHYWDRIAGDALPTPLALVMLDAAVNNGPYRAALWMQGAVGVEADGLIGPQTLLCVRAYLEREGATALITELLAQRLAYMAALPTWRLFGLGWARRLCGLAFQCLTFSEGAT